MTCLLLLFLATEEGNFCSNFLRIVYIAISKLEGAKKREEGTWLL